MYPRYQIGLSLVIRKRNWPISALKSIIVRISIEVHEQMNTPYFYHPEVRRMISTIGVRLIVFGIGDELRVSLCSHKYVAVSKDGSTGTLV